MKEIIYRGNWVLINAYFYSFWMLRSEFDQYKIEKNILEKLKIMKLN